MSWIRKLLGGGGAQGKREPVVPIASIELPPQQDGETLRQDQPLRKGWAEEVLTGYGIPINRSLPCIESEADITLRPVREVADRLLALSIVAVKGEGLEHERVLEVIGGLDCWNVFTPKELAFLHNPATTEHDRIQFVWRYEAAWVLFWALNFTDAPLSYPANICDVPLLMSTVRETQDLGARGLQSANNILNEADLIYRYHWAVRQASIDGVEPPGGLEPGVVMERHYALNWLIGYMDQEWDDVSTDT